MGFDDETIIFFINIVFSYDSKIAVNFIINPHTKDQSILIVYHVT
jgi:hypothetical protein